jgi:hypothetical protein
MRVTATTNSFSVVQYLLLDEQCGLTATTNQNILHLQGDELIPNGGGGGRLKSTKLANSLLVL